MVAGMVSPDSKAQAETDSLASLLAEFDGTGDTTKMDFLKHRYAGFSRKEASTLAGVTIKTTNSWRKSDPRIARFDDLVTTGSRRGLRKDVLQEEWFRNFYLVLEQDKYILNKVHGLLEERVMFIEADGTRKWTIGSPAMTNSDWGYYAQRRRMYTPDAWASIEKAIVGEDTTCNIAELVLNMAQQQQVNVGS